MQKGVCLIIIILLFVPTLCGCVRRKMTIMSNPPGATVYLDGKDIGRTPFSTNFDHYGKREFRVVKPGYETKTELISVRAPWYQWVGIDFISEVLMPGKLTDHKSYEFELQPQKEAIGSEIVTRAEEFRQTAYADGVPHVGGGSTIAPPSPVGSITPAASDFSPIVPNATLFNPPSTSVAPNTFVPPVLTTP